MPQGDYFTFLIIGVVFILLGVGAYFWGRHEETRYFNTIVRRPDVREFVEHLPARPEPGSLKIGGRVTVIIGVVLLALSFILTHLAK